MSVVAMWHFTAATEHLKNQIISSFSMYSQRRDFESPQNMMNYNLLFKLIRTSLDKNWTIDYEVLKFTDWKEVINIASAHGLSAIAYDGLKMSLDSNPERRNEIPKSLLLQWYGQCVHQTALFNKNWSTSCSLSSLLGEHGIEAVVLKGRSIAQYYPIPEHRYSCDLDLFVAGDDWERACEILEAKGIRLEREVYKEVEFTFEGLYAELHRYITPVRGNQTLLRFERYLRNILKENPKTYFEGTKLVRPPLMFIVMLYIEHALGDLLHGKLTLKHVADWVVLRKQEIDRMEIEARCKEFGFYRFLMLMDSLADVVEGKMEMTSLAPSHREVLDSFFVIPSSVNKKKKSWFACRVSLFFDIIRNRRHYKRFGYCSMERFLVSAVWTHFFDKEVSIVNK